MAYALVFLAALLVGGLVYLVTIRQGQVGPAAPQDAVTMSAGGDGAPPAQPPTSGTVYVPVVAMTRSWETRLTGLAGIVVIVALGAVALALSVYAAGSFLVGLVTDAAGNGGVNGGVPAP